MGAASDLAFDPWEANFVADPYPAYAELRRRLVPKAFTPRMVEQLKPYMDELAGELVVGLLEADGVSRLSYPVALTSAIQRNWSS